MEICKDMDPHVGSEKKEPLERGNAGQGAGCQPAPGVDGKSRSLQENNGRHKEGS